MRLLNPLAMISLSFLVGFVTVCSRSARATLDAPSTAPTGSSEDDEGPRTNGVAFTTVDYRPQNASAPDVATCIHRVFSNAKITCASPQPRSPKTLTSTGHDAPRLLEACFETPACTAVSCSAMEKGKRTCTLRYSCDEGGVITPDPKKKGSQVVVLDARCRLTAAPTQSPSRSPSASPTPAYVPPPPKSKKNKKKKKKKTTTTTKKKKKSNTTTKKTKKKKTKSSGRGKGVHVVKSTGAPVSEEYEIVGAGSLPPSTPPTVRITHSPTHKATKSPTTRSPTPLPTTSRPTAAPTTKAPTTSYPTLAPNTIFTSPSRIPASYPLDWSQFHIILPNTKLCMVVRTSTTAQSITYPNFNGDLEDCLKECQYDFNCQGSMFSVRKNECVKSTALETSDSVESLPSYVGEGWVAYSRNNAIVGYFAGYCAQFHGPAACKLEDQCGWDPATPMGYNQIKLYKDMGDHYCGRVKCDSGV